MSGGWHAALGALPWALLALLMLWRTRGSHSIAAHSPLLDAATAPRLSVIVPARNEELNIERCLRSICASTHPHMEVVVLDDHSEDNTGRLALEVAKGDRRVVVTSPPPLPKGWFGKSWACQHGASIASGEIFLFTDADTWHHPELAARLCNTMVDMKADLLSVGGAQEVVTFWEKLVQPMVFLLLLFRYGGTGVVNRSRVARNKIANGQCIMTTREAYFAVGGHNSVRATVAEDLMLAQVYFTAGRNPVLALALPYLSTRMYRSLGEVVGGWGKNIFAASAHTLPGGWIWRKVLAPVLLLLPPLITLLLPLALLLYVLWGNDAGVLTTLAASSATLFVLYTMVFAAFRVSPLYAFLYPVGAAVLLYIVATAIARGQQVSWKGRKYTSS